MYFFLIVLILFDNLDALSGWFLNLDSSGWLNHLDPPGKMWQIQMDGKQHGAGASISLTKTYRTIFVSNHVFGQKNGPGVFVHPDGMIIFGLFRN